jgi:beta-glucosidase
LTDVLYGHYNPSGRLPFTIAKKREDYGVDVLYSSPDPIPQITYSEGLLIDYRWFDAKNISPRFEFGFGLSYTTFEYVYLEAQTYGTAGGAVKSSDPR